MKGARTIAALSCAAGLALPACQVRQGWEGFVATAGGRRLVEPRLTGGFAYSPCRPSADPSALIPELRCSDLPREESRAGKAVAHVLTGITKVAERQPTARHLQARALARLVLPRAASSGSDRPAQRGGESGSDPAVADLEQAAHDQPDDAHLWSDLSAAHLLRAARTGDPYALLDALGAADRAVAADRALPEALFNRALVLERLFLQGAARAAWQQYLAIDRDSEWAREAQSHLAALDRPLGGSSVGEVEGSLVEAPGAVEEIVRRAPQLAREAAERRLLRTWASGELHGNFAATSRALATARQVGVALARGGERMVQDSVAVIDAAAGDPERRRALAEGHLALSRGWDLYQQRHTDEAALHLEAARAAFARAGSPAAATADFLLANCANFAGRSDEALAALLRLKRELAGSGYRSLAAHAAWMNSYILAVQGRLPDSLAESRRAAAAFEQIGESANAGSVHTLVAEGLEKLGRHREAWQEVYRGLRAASGLASPDDRWLAATIAAEHALKQGRPEIALYFQDEAASAAKSSIDATLLPDTLFWRAAIEQLLGRTERVPGDLREARRRIAELPTPAVRQRMEADFATITAESVLATDPRAAIQELSGALALYERTGHHLLALRAHRARGHAYLRLGDTQHAEADLLAALVSYEQLGRPTSDKTRSEELRLSFLQETDEVFDEVIAFEVDRERPFLAWAFADRARTRVLPENALRAPMEDPERERLLAAEPEPLPLAEVERRLPAGTTLLEYSVLGDRVLIWRLRNGARDFFSIRTTPAELERETAVLRHATGKEAARVGAALFARLLSQPLAGVDPGESLVVIPDKVLHAVPFAALRGPDGHYLVEDHRIVVAPSATLYVRALDHERALAVAERGPARLLVFGNPAFNAMLFNDLTPLVGAGREAERIAALDPDHSLLRRGASADKASFLALAPRFERLHLATHALIDGRNPLLSALVLAPGAPGDPGALYAREVYSLRLPRTRLVVLAACDTGNAYLPGSEGATTLGRAFLAAGVPTVVASLWDVDDRVTAGLLERFHVELQAGADPASALQLAQVAALRDPNSAHSPADWAAFEVFGASLLEPKRLLGRVR